MKTLKCRGQAWIVFSTTQEADSARKSLSGFVFCGAPLQIEYAAKKSNIVRIAEGTYFSRPEVVAAAQLKRNRMEQREQEAQEDEIDHESKRPKTIAENAGINPHPYHHL